MKFTLNRADCSGDPRNTFYPKTEQVDDSAKLREAVTYDHVCGCFKGSMRSKENFQFCDVVVMDCDNEGTDDPKGWVDLNELDEIFGFDTAFAAVTSKSHMKPKGQKSARPRFHVYFPVGKIDTADECAALKGKIAQEYPFFDKGALDAARFIYGVKDAEIYWHDGKLNIGQVCSEQVIYEGNRNSALSRYAARLLIRLGNQDDTYRRFLEKAKSCVPPLDDDELLGIWASAQKFYAKVSRLPGYVPPEEYEEEMRYPHQPKRRTDVAEAAALAKFSEKKMRYSPATKFIVYHGGLWEESDELAHQVMHDFTEAQIADVEKDLIRYQKEYESRNLAAKFTTRKRLRKGETLSDNEQKLLALLAECEAYHNMAIYYQDSKHLRAVLEEVKPKILVNVNDLDANPYLLNTPAGTINLLDCSIKAHDPEDYITKMTAVSPSDEGGQLWLDALKVFFCGDQELIDYVQMVMGQVIIGKVQEEKLYIFYGDGRNGKSTFTNACARVLGSYAGSITAEALTQNAKGNVQAQIAEIKGVRLVVASELESNRQLSASTAKRLSSTDPVDAEKKYKAPFKFKPTHSLILHTNHLPNVVDFDTGIWRRLVVIPFEAVIEGKKDIKDFTSYLVENAGGAILQWMIDGAKKLIAGNGKIELPQCVKEATDRYRNDSDWVAEFIEECCVVGAGEHVKAGEFYQAYQNYCESRLERAKPRKLLKEAMVAKGFKHHRSKLGVFYKGIRLAMDFDSEDLPF